MKTPAFLALLVLGILVAPLVIEAQPRAKIPQVGFLDHSRQADEPRFRRLKAFWHGLRDLGYVEGDNLVLEIRYAEGKDEWLPALAAELVRLPVEVIVTTGAPAARAAQQATTTVPIVIITLTDPIGAGFVSRLARPGGNITGVSGPSAAFIGKQLELLKDAVPGITRVAVLLHPTHPMASPIVSEIARAAQALGIQLHLLEVHGPSELDTVLAAITRTREEATASGAPYSWAACRRGARAGPGARLCRDMDDTTTRTPPRVARAPWWELVRVFLTLGALSPSGPGLTGVLQTEIQEKRAWLSQARFVEGVALVNMLPGPGGAQLSIFLGYIRAGWWGGCSREAVSSYRRLSSC